MLSAQVSTANVAGEVDDSTESRISGAEIKLVNQQTGAENAVVTGGDGRFLLSGVLPGSYSMQVYRDGFASMHFFDLTLNVGESKQFRIVLRLERIQQTIEVDASGTSLDRTDAQMSTLVDSHLIAGLPLNGRSFQDLITITPGVQLSSPQAARTNGFSVNGQTVDTNVYLIDGASANFGTAPLEGDFKVPAVGQYAVLTTLATTQGLVGLEALQEFRVISATPSSEYGRGLGGQFSLSTRTGSNDIHASAFAYLRNGYFDAADWYGAYDTRSGYQPYYQQDVGGSLSAPLKLGSHNAHKQGNLFVSYEELHESERGAPAIEYAVNSQLTQQAPAAVQSVVVSLPLKYLTDSASLLVPPTLGEQYSANGPNNFKSLDVRLSRTFGRGVSGFVRYGQTPSGSNAGDLQGTTSLAERNRNVTVGIDGQLSSRAGNELRLNWAQSSARNIFQDSPWSLSGLHRSSFDLAALLHSPRPAPLTRAELYVRDVGTGSIDALADEASGRLTQYQLRDQVSFQQGKHLWQIGFDHRMLHGAIDPQPWSVSVNMLSAEDVLNNHVPVAVIRRSLSAHPSIRQSAAFIQDSWRIVPALTINAGLRWDVNPAPTTTDGKAPYVLSGDVSQPSTVSIRPPGKSLWRTDWLALSPRLGAAWDVSPNRDHNLVVRGGLGILSDDRNRLAALAFTGLGFSSSSIQHDTVLPIAWPDVPDPADIANASRSSVGYLFPESFGRPYTLQWSGTLDRAIGQHQFFSASYVGSRGFDLAIPRRLQLTNTTAPVRELVSFSQRYRSQFNSLQLSYRGSSFHGMTWMVSYSLGHAFDFGPTNPWAAPKYGSADTDVRHNLQAAFTWKSPSLHTKAILRNTVGGWQLGARFSARSAYPVNPLGSLFFDPVSGERFFTGVDLVPGTPLYLYSHSLPGGRQLNGGPSNIGGAFQLPQSGSDGNAPRNLARGFGAQDLGISLEREIPLHDRLHLELRGEVFNLTNSPSFGYMNPYLTDVLFGQATLSLNQSYGGTGSLYQPGGPRSLQWMFRFRW